MRSENFDIDNTIEYLRGTCTNTIDSAVNELYPGMNEGDLTVDETNQIDDEIFECDDCGWWCEVSQRCETDGDGDVCEECHSEQGGVDDYNVGE